jgi:4-amino-4-deoxy-L-arabinose transferase-like glycosyltransferase
VVQGPAGSGSGELQRQMGAVSLREAIAAALGRFLDALCDPQRRERTVILTLALYCVAWTVYALVAKASQDIHFDMGEMVAWSREIALGTPKHPPLPAWIAAAWFWVFPLDDWAYDLLAMATATVALWVAWRLSGYYLDDRKRVAGLAMLTLVPFFNFHALKYNANTAMMPWWALTTLFFLRSFETRGVGFAALAGVAAAGAMMSKYWSIVLLAALAIAALCDPRRRLYFRSAAPYVTAAVGAAALAPHVAWLVLHKFASFGYALDSHPATLGEALLSGVGYAAGSLAYAIVPILVFAAVVPSRAAVADSLWPADPHRRIVVMAFVVPLLLPALLAVASSEKVVSLWSIAGTSLLPVVLLSSALVPISRAAALRILGLAVVFPFLAILAAPVVAIAVHRHGVANFGDQYRLIAEAADKVWRDTTQRPLRLVGSYNNVLLGSAFYFPERPSTYEIVSPHITPWTDDARIARDGILMYCPQEIDICMKSLEAWAAKEPQARRVEITLARDFLGTAGQATRYTILAIPPRVPSGA